MSETLYLLLLLNNFEGAHHAHPLSVGQLRPRLSIFPILRTARGGTAQQAGPRQGSKQIYEMNSGGFLPPSPPAEKATASQDRGRRPLANDASSGSRASFRSGSLSIVKTRSGHDGAASQARNPAATTTCASFWRKAVGSLVRQSSRQLGVDGR
jgi:hypothetical protein